MIASIRTALFGVLALCLVTGLLGCSIFSQPASAAAAPLASPATMDHAHHHHGADEAPQMDLLHAHHGDDPASDCDGCKQTLANRASIAPEKAVNGSTLPLPVLVIPASLQLEDNALETAKEDWPPGLDPPLRPSTLTYQKVSLLI